MQVTLVQSMGSDALVAHMLKRLPCDRGTLNNALSLSDTERVKNAVEYSDEELASCAMTFCIEEDDGNIYYATYSLKDLSYDLVIERDEDPELWDAVDAIVARRYPVAWSALMELSKDD